MLTLCPKSERIILLCVKMSKKRLLLLLTIWLIARPFYLKTQLKVQLVTLNSKLESFNRVKLNCDKMESHIKVSHRRYGCGGGKQHVVVYFDLKVKLFLLSSRLSRRRRRSKRSFRGCSGSCEHRRFFGSMRWGKRRRSRLRQWRSGL